MVSEKNDAGGDGPNDVAAIERVDTGTEDVQKDRANYERMDKELAKYAEAAAIEISPDENKRLRRLIDRRVLACMIFTYFLQVRTHPRN